LGCAVAGQSQGRGIAHLSQAARSSATSRARLRLYSASSLNARYPLDDRVFAQLQRSADYVYPRCPGHVASRSRGRGGQWNVNARSGADRHTVRDGVSGGSAYLDLGPPSSKGGPVRHGELDRPARCGARVGAGRFHRRPSRRRSRCSKPEFPPWARRKSSPSAPCGRP